MPLGFIVYLVLLFTARVNRLEEIGLRVASLLIPLALITVFVGSLYGVSTGCWPDCGGVGALISLEVLALPFVFDGLVAVLLINRILYKTRSTTGSARD